MNVSPEHADRFCYGHYEGPTEVNFHQGDEGEFVVISAPVPAIIFLVPLPVGSSSKYGRLVSLGDDEK